ncbi:MAG TPA: TetR/AcrR family transcriptional regulator [Vineibacter sp.]|nr:TetR/AcrR family transcriptional regulator [Vineibacter sp.]
MAERQAVIEAFLKLLAEKGWHGFALRDVAEAASVGLAELYDVFPSRVALIEGFMSDLDRQVLAGTTPSQDPDETVRDRLFDTLMRRYDAMRPHREAVAALAEGLARDPVVVLALSRAMDRSMAAVLEASGVQAEGWRGALRQKALAAMHLAVLRVWLNDDSADQSKTMAALDHRLKRVERWAQAFDRVGKSARRWRPGREAAAPSSDATSEGPPA